MSPNNYVYIAAIIVALFTIQCSGSNVDRAVVASGHLAESKDCQKALYANHDIVKFNACQDAVDTRFGIPPYATKDGGQ